MLDRREDGKLRLNSLDLQIFLGDIFVKCKNEHEVEWLQEQVSSCVEGIAEERLNEFEGEGE